MPLFNYKCGECGLKKRHFQNLDSSDLTTCPKCTSTQYKKQLPVFKLDVQYTTKEEMMEFNVDPGVRSIMEQMGKEIANEDTRTLENIFGEQAVKDSVAEKDDWVDALEVENI